MAKGPGRAVGDGDGAPERSGPAEPAAPPAAPDGWADRTTAGFTRAHGVTSGATSRVAPDRASPVEWTTPTASATRATAVIAGVRRDLAMLARRVDPTSRSSATSRARSGARP